LSLAAEMQWQLLQGRGLQVPDQFRSTPSLKPAELISSDLFGGAHDEQDIAIPLLDAAGDGGAAAQNSQFALMALRNARQASLNLPKAVSFGRTRIVGPVPG
jgi:hypothetical protein